MVLWLAGLWLATSSGWALGLTLESTGPRFGFGSSHSSFDFYQADAAVKWDLPWHWEFGTNWLLQTRLEATAGWLSDGYKNGALMASGPSLVFSRARIPISLEAGLEPTLLTRSEYVAKDFGQLLQFTSFAGLNFDLGSHFRVGCRFQHMSNAHLSSKNPGLNMTLVGLFYRF